ncbi:MAG: ABC transporter ATP-binding protein [Lachnospiraceae bacterium]|nr:ABC transporter ATP-binding protein [Lachnospiraceae bacterium]
MENILELNNVSKKYARSDFALDNISFSLPAGCIMGLVGENGAGKTTTIGCILNTIFKDSGRIKIFGKELSDDDKEMREKIGVVYDSDNFPGYLSAAQLADIMSGIYQQWDSTLFQKYLNIFHLIKEQKIKTYSKGMTMKLAMAAALAHHPQLLILDEATSGLDPVMRDEMLDVFLDFVGDEKHSVLLSSHITSDLEKVADYITFLHNGKMILTASKDELIYQYAIMRCRESQFKVIDPEDIIAFRRRDYQIDVLVSNQKEAGRKYKDVVMDQTSIDEIALLLAKGRLKWQD